MVDSVQLSPALEDYLETLSRIISEKRVARVRDIAANLGVHKSTVTAALKSLAEKGLVDYSPYEVTTLTGQGQKLADEVVRRHQQIREFLAEVLGVDEGVADANACRMEHIMDKEVLERLAALAVVVQESRRHGRELLPDLSDYMRRSERTESTTPRRPRHAGPSRNGGM